MKRASGGGGGIESGCDAARLRGLLDDTLAEDEGRAALDHLGACAACQRQIEGLAADETWWENLRRFAPRALPAGEESTLGLLAPSDDPKYVGRLGRYEVTGIVGRGGMGLVLKAFDPPLNRFVAIKVLAPELATSGAARLRFGREAKAAAAVAHEHVVPIFAVDEAGGLPYLVMPYIAGRSLRDRIDRDGPLGLEAVLRVGMQAAQGLAAAHAQGLVHRDVKPANILLENGVERVKLTDFGLARAVDDASLTQSGVVTGTPEYMSPEQARGEPVDHRSDLFSLGGVLYACCTGHSPFRAGSSLAVLKRVCEARHRPIRFANPALPGWLEEVVDRLLEKDPSRRFATAAEVAELLGRHLARTQNPALPAVDHDWLKPRPGAWGRRRRLTGLAAVALGVALLAGGWAWTPRHGPFAQLPLDPGGAAPPEGPATPDPARLKAEFYQDFRKARFDPRTLKVARWNTDRMFRPEPDGLRVTIPASQGKMYQVGIAPRFRVRGDFEVESSYSVLKGDPPRDGYGLGFTLAVEADSPGKVTLNLENSDVPPKKGKDDARPPGRSYNATLIAGPPDKRTYSPGAKPATVKAGTLRITRVGPTASAWYSETGGPFRLLRRVELGSEDLREVFVGANAGGSGHALDLLIHDLRIRAEDLPGHGGSPAAPSSRSPWRVAVAGAAALAVAAAVLGWAATRRRRLDPATAPAAPGNWDEEGLKRLEEEACAYADEHPNAGAFSKRPRFQFTLKDGALNGPFAAWHEVEPDALKRLGKTWDEVRPRLAVRFEGEYRGGRRHGLFVCRDQAGAAVERRYQNGERVQ